MRFFDRSFSFGLLLCGLPLLFFPKISLFSLGDRETAGVRIDDLVLFGLCLLIIWAHFSVRKTMGNIERLIVAIVSLSLCSFVLNRFFVQEGWLHVNASIFYCVRIAEYFIFFYIGALSIQFFRTSSIVTAFFIWNAVLMFLQKADFLGQFTLGSYVDSVSGRVVGIASFPSEAGMLIDLVFCYLIYNETKTPFFKKILAPDIYHFFKQTYVYWLFLLCSVLVIITGSRIAIIGLIIPFLCRIKNDLKKGRIGTWFYGLVFLAAACILTIIMIQKTDAISERSAGLLSVRNLQLIGTVWDKIDLAYDPIGNEAVEFDAYDRSWWMRIHKWVYAFKIYYMHPESWLQGVGPGFAMAALDGGWLRILTEYGVVGLLLFIKLFSAISRQSLQLRWMMVAFSVNMIFFDVYLAYKPMSILFFVSGCAWATSCAQTRHPVPLKASQKPILS